MPMKRLLAKGLYRLAEGTLKEFRNEHGIRSDLGPVIARLIDIERQLTPKWVGYTILVLSGLSIIVAVWALVRTY